MNIEKKKIGCFVIGLVSLSAIIGISMLGPIPQDVEYHRFSDDQMIMGIPNFMNVLSNAPFLLVGILGLYRMLGSNTPAILYDLKTAYILFFVGVSLVSLGSGYYHLLPSNETLVWDRLPMTIAFMALFSIIIGEFVSLRVGKYALWPLIISGLVSVGYWDYTERLGEGDLRPYILVQFLPILIIPLLLSFFNSKFSNESGYWWLLGAYLLAKILEHFDSVIYSYLIVISGHSLKHLVAALGVYFLLHAYDKRHIYEVNEEPLEHV